MTPAELIAANLQALPHPDGTPRQLSGFSTRLLPEALQSQITQTAKDVGEAIIHLLDINGYTVTDKHQPSQPTQASSIPVANLHCRICDTRLLTINMVNPSHATTDGRMLIKALGSKNPECPHA